MNTIEKSLASQSLVNLISRISILLSTIIFYSVVFRFLTKEQVAILAVFEFLPPLIDFFPNLGFQATIMKLLPEKKLKNFDEARLFVQINAYMIQSFFCLLAILVIIFSKDISYILLKNSKFSTEIGIIAIWSCIYTFSDRLLIVKQALGDYHYVAYFNMFRYIVSRIGGIILVMLGYGVSVIIIFFTVIFFTSIFIIGKSIKDFLFPFVLFQYRLEITKKIKYSFPFYCQGWGRYLMSYIDQPMVSFLFRPEILAVYFLTRKLISTLIISTIEALREPLVPKLIKLFSIKEEGEVFSVYYKATILLNFLVLVGLIIVTTFPSKILSIFAGEQYESYYMYLIFFSIYFFAFHIFNNLNVIVFVTKSPTWIFYCFITSGLINLATSLVLGYLLGIKWFIIGQSIGFFIVSLILLIKYKVVEIKKTDTREFLIIFITNLILSLILLKAPIVLKCFYFFCIFFILLFYYRSVLSKLSSIRIARMK